MFLFLMGLLCSFWAIWFMLVDLLLGAIRKGIYEIAYSFLYMQWKWIRQ